MANLTITVDGETLKRARLRAIERGETVNAYLADQLRKYTEDDREEIRQQDTAARLIELSMSLGGNSQGRQWSREDLYDDRRVS